MSKLANIAENVGNLEERVYEDEYLSIVNADPPNQFIQDHPMAKGVVYMPIDKVETLLTKVFQSWYVEVLDAKQMLNSVSVTVRLFYKHPVTGEFHHQDGVGAAPIQTDKGAEAMDATSVKNNAIMLALPAAKSYAIKDAAEHIGRLFGRDINRKDTLGFTPTYGTDENIDKLEAAKEEKRKKLEAENADN